MGHGCVKNDPAIDRFNTMRENAYLNFRWTRRTMRTAFIGFVVAPVAVYYVASAFHLRWDWAGKLKGQSLAAKPSNAKLQKE
jgi:hypothetical protein